MKCFLVLLLLLSVAVVGAQPRFSIASDITLLRNFSPGQKFFAIGQTVQAQVHLQPRETLFGTIRYYAQGSFHNDFTATAVSPLTLPSTKSYRVDGIWRVREIVLGWKHYFRGGFDSETAWNLYGLGGFGLIFTNVENSLVTSIDSSVYRLQPAPRIGSGSWKRLSLDLGLGGEYPMGGNFYVYGELQTWIHTSAYPSPWLHRNDQVPLPVTLDIGLRVLFGE